MHPQFYKDDSLSTSDPDPEPRQHYEVHCGSCGWWGKICHMICVYVSNPSEPGDVIPEPACPICLSYQYLEYKDDSEDAILARQQSCPSIYMTRLMLSARYRDECYATLLGILNCQTYQSKNSEGA